MWPSTASGIPAASHPNCFKLPQQHVNPHVGVTSALQRQQLLRPVSTRRRGTFPCRNQRNTAISAAAVPPAIRHSHSTHASADVICIVPLRQRLRQRPGRRRLALAARLRLTEDDHEDDQEASDAEDDEDAEAVGIEEDDDPDDEDEVDLDPASRDDAEDDDVDLDVIVDSNEDAEDDDPAAEVDNPDAQEGELAAEEEDFEEPTLDDLDALIGEDFDLDAEALAAEEELMGMSSNGAPAEDAEEAEQEAKSDPELQYPRPPRRQYALGDLLQEAARSTSKTDVQEWLGAAAVAEQLSPEQLQTVVTDVAFDPRKVKPGCLFICVNAENFDGHDFTECCVENGAVGFVTTQPLDSPPPDGFPVFQVPDTIAVMGPIAAAFCDNPSYKVATVGVTGSAGKTTTSWLIRSIFEELGQVTGMLGSLEYAIAEDRMTDEGDLFVPGEDDPTLKRDCSAPDHITPHIGKYGVPQSTPNALAMHKILAGVADRGAESVVIECTTTGLEEGRVDEVDFDIAVFTNLTEENLDDGGEVQPAETLPEHIEKMTRLFQRLNNPEGHRAVINVDDPNADVFKQASLAVPVVTYAILDRDADVLAEKLTMTGWESDIIIRTPLGRLQIITPLVGKANVYNILAAVAVGIAMGVNLTAIVKGIEAVDVVPGRTEIIDEGQPFPVIVDCANTPDTLSRLLEGVRETGVRRILTVFGAEGHTPAAERALLGEILHFKSDFVFVTNNNPAFEEPSAIVDELVAGFPRHIHEYGNISGQPHWLRDLNTMPPEIDPNGMERDHRMECQGLFRRFVMEDRFSAIRCAIGTAQPRDAVVIAGKGAQDYQLYGLPETGDLMRGWFDDRVEARNALSKLAALDSCKGLDREELPWTYDPESRAERDEDIMGCDVRQFVSP